MLYYNQLAYLSNQALLNFFDCFPNCVKGKSWFRGWQGPLSKYFRQTSSQVLGLYSKIAIHSLGSVSSSSRLISILIDFVISPFSPIGIGDSIFLLKNLSIDNYSIKFEKQKHVMSKLSYNKAFIFNKAKHFEILPYDQMLTIPYL